MEAKVHVICKIFICLIKYLVDINCTNLFCVHQIHYNLHVLIAQIYRSNECASIRSNIIFLTI